MSEMSFTFEDLMKEVDNYIPRKTMEIQITPQQKEFIVKARERKMSYTVMAELWSKVEGWGKMSKGCMIRRTNIVMKQMTDLSIS